MPKPKWLSGSDGIRIFETFLLIGMEKLQKRGDTINLYVS